MKLTVALLLVACFQVNATSYAQQVTLKVRNTSLKQVFTEIRKQTGYVFFCNESILEKADRITLDVQGAELKTILDQCLKDQSLDYSIIGNNVVIKLKEAVPIQGIPDSIPGKPLTFAGISGRVTNEQKEPLSGCNVIIKRTGKGTTTNANGMFTLKDALPTDLIVISYIGYKTLQLKVGNHSSFPLVMEITTDDLDKVVVQAYGQTTDRLTTGNIVTVTAKEIERQPVMNPLLALQGRVTGLLITQTSGYASGIVKSEIRGRSSLNAKASGEPLYIIDGVPLTVLEISENPRDYESGSAGFTQSQARNPAGGQSPLFSINPSDIESITVLKDADATAIYGSRGANGVIIINTKRGMAGKTKLEGNVYQGINMVTRHWEMMNREQYLEMRREAFKNDNIQMTTGNAYDLLVWDTTRSTDWQKYLWGSLGKTTDAQLSLSGGDEHNSFRMSTGYHRENDIKTSTGSDQRITVAFNWNHKSRDQKLSVNFSGTYSVTNSDMIGLSGQVKSAPNTPPVFDADGKLNYAGWDPATREFTFGTLLEPYNSQTNFLNSKFAIKYRVATGLHFSTSFGYSYMNNAELRQTPIISQDPSINPLGESFFGLTTFKNWITEPQLTYDLNIGGGKMAALLGASLQTSDGSSKDMNGVGYVNDNLLGSISNAPVKYISDSYAQYKYAAIFGRLNYNWKDKYLINLSVRRDGSSRFGPGNQFGNFGSVGVAWILSEEAWFKKILPFLSFAKLRGSYGITGSDNVGPYRYLTRWSGNGMISYQAILPYIPTQHANPNYQWEENRKLEGALSFGLVNDRIRFEAAWYQHRCNNQLIDFMLPQMTGFKEVTANSPANVQNTGWEFTLNGKLIDQKKIKWSARFNISLNRNKLLSYPNLKESPDANRFIVGHPLNITRLLKFTGVDPATGYYTAEDRNKDGIINYEFGKGADLYILDLNPKFFGGFGTDLSWYGLEVSLFFSYKKQINKNALSGRETPGEANLNQPVEVLDRWQKPGDIARYARFTTLADITFAEYSSSDAMYTDASYIRLSNLSISYKLSSGFTRSIGLQGGSVFIRSQNLFVITDYKGLDPETGTFGEMPPYKSFVAGIQFNL